MQRILEKNRGCFAFFEISLRFSNFRDFIILHDELNIFSTLKTLILKLVDKYLII